MTWCLDDLKFEAFPIVDIATPDCTCNGNRIPQCEQMGSKIVTMINQVISRIPELIGFFEEALLLGWNYYLRPSRHETRNRRTLVAMMGGEEDPINWISTRDRVNFSRVNQKFPAISFEKG